MNNTYGELKYIGRDLLKFVLPLKEVFPGNVYFLYYAGQEPYTRIVEYKKLTKQRLDSPTTLLTIEFPSNNGRYYPLPYNSEMKRAKNYFADMPENVFSIGRAGSYDYGVDIDDSIEQAMEIVNNL
jgi:UDP-galactopyranose mutase